MRVRFTKMQGAGNDFVVLDETRARLNLSAAQVRRLADRHFGVGADQVLSVRPSPAPGIDFEYVIDKGLTSGTRIKVRTLSGVIEPRVNADGRVTVDMGPPEFEPALVPFDDAGLSPDAGGLWHLALDTSAGS